jgi:type VI protein secretion system component VasK
LYASHAAPATEKKDPKRVAGLYESDLAPECARLKAVSDDKLDKEMQFSTSPKIVNFAKRCAGHTQCLRAAVEELLCAGQ